MNHQHSTEFDYTPIVLRTDPTCQHTDLAPARPGTLDLTAARAGDIAASLPIIGHIWAEVSPDPRATEAMLAVLLTFTNVTAAQGSARWSDITTEDVAAFVHDDQIDPTARRLTKNTIHAAYLALADAGIPTGHPEDRSPATGLDPLPSEVRTDQRGKRRGNATTAKTRTAYDKRVHVRAATHDEVLLTRLATRFTGSSRAQGLSAAAVAICSSTATTGEAPQVLWRDLGPGGQCLRVALPGRAAAPGYEETAIQPRTVALDPWDAQALADWHAERSEARPVSPDASILYGGNKALDSTTAGICADQAVRKALDIADLRREPGLSAGSLRLWAAARTVTDYDSLTDAATRAGIAATTLHREIHHLGERALRGI